MSKIQEINIEIAGYQIKILTDDEKLHHIITDKSRQFILKKCRKKGVVFLIKKQKEYVEICEKGKRKKIFKLKHKEEWLKHFQTLRLAMMYWLVKKKCVILHSSVIKTKDGIVLFSGPTGNGKTTLAHIASQKGAEILQEDEAVIKKVRGKYLVYPFSLIPPHHEFYKNKNGELKTIIFVGHAHKKNFLKKLSQLDAYKNLIANDFLMYISTMFQIKKRYIKKIAQFYYKFSKKKTFYRLKFVPNQQAVRYLNEKIGLQ